MKSFGIKLCSLIIIIQFMPVLLMAASGDNIANEPNIIASLRKKALESPHGKRAIREVVDEFASSEGDQLEELYSVLAVRKNEAVPEVIRKLDTGTVPEKRKMTKLLRQTRWPEAVPKLLAIAASDKENEISRIGALYSLGAIGNRSIAARIAEQLDKSDRSITEKRVIISTLARLKYAQAIPRIEKYIDANDTLLRIYAIRALADLGQKTDIQFLKESLNNEDFFIRESACGALGSCEGDEAVKALNEIIKSDSIQSVREEAQLSLMRIELSKMNEPKHSEFLGKLTERPEKKVRAWAIDSLAFECGEKGRVVLREKADTNPRDRNKMTFYLLIKSDDNSNAKGGN